MPLRYDLARRLEPARPAGQLDRGFRAEVADPAWFLAAQWLMSEHEGEDSASPVAVSVTVSEVPIDPFDGDPALDPRTVPAEVIVESEPGDWWTPGRRVRVGLAAEPSVPVAAREDPALKLTENLYLQGPQDAFAAPNTHFVARREPPPVQPPKPLAKPVEFKSGDHVVYPTHGVGTVQGIETMSAAGYALQVIVVTFDENRMTLRVPVGKAASSGLRKLASSESMTEALDTLRGRARVKRTMWSRRAQEYEAKINSGDPVQIAEVVRDLHRNAGQPDQSFSERQIYEQALDRLAAELAAIDRSDKPAATEKLLNHLNAA